MLQLVQVVEMLQMPQAVQRRQAMQVCHRVRLRIGALMGEGLGLLIRLGLLGLVGLA